MRHDHTQDQSPADEVRSRDLSLKQARPPLEIPGYTIERFLGSGAYGEVWVGVDRNTGRRVAIKFYAHRRGVDWSLLSREVEKLVFLSADRYVVQLLEVGWDANPPFYVMEFIESGSLEDLLKTRHMLPVAEAVDLFREISTGLAHAHGKGVLHCDLKPANILLDPDHHPRLADFGQSRLSHEQTPALGTLIYMAPEQADLNAVPDVRWDIYALGAILHCMLTGEPPHRTEEVVTQIDTAVDLPDRLAKYRQAITTTPPVQLQRKVRGVDRALAEIVSCCLAADPEQRYSSVQEILAALQTRQRARQMRPVLAFGFIFPLLMLVVAALFGWRGYQKALGETETLATQRATENNEFAARLAAEQVAGEIERFFNTAEGEASQDDLRKRLTNVLDLPERAELADPNLVEPAGEVSRMKFLDDPHQDELDKYLANRLARYQRHPKLASIFVLDDLGTQLAAAHAGEEVSQSVGRNFAYRAYFHGRPSDLERSIRVPEVQPAPETHLSAVFQSSTTKQWKVAIATPIEQTTDDSTRIVGVFVITVNLGDFEFFKSVQDPDRDRFAVLVDGRPGASTGIVLQHPLFDEIRKERKPIPDTFRNARVSLTPEGSLESSRYIDPLSSDPLGEKYRREWLATSMQVRSRHVAEASADSAPPTGLVVLVQEDYHAVIEPVRQLGTRLVREGILALVVLVLVTTLLWYMVLRLVRPQQLPETPRLLPSADSASVHGAPTLPISGRP